MTTENKNCDILPKVDSFSTGVYRIHCTVNGRNYVGSAARCFIHRWRMHLHQLRNGKHHSLILQRSWIKYGESSFVFEIIERCDPVICVEREQYYMDKLKSADCNFGFNISPTAGSPLGVKHTLESCLRRSIANKGRKMPPRTKEHIDKIRAKQIGKKQTPEQIARRIGRKHTPESIAQMRAVKIGKKKSLETIEKMRVAKLGKPHSAAHVASMIGRIVTQETRAKIRAKLIGRKATPEILQKIKEGWIRRRERLSAKPLQSASEVSRQSNQHQPNSAKAQNRLAQEWSH